MKHKEPMLTYNEGKTFLSGEILIIRDTLVGGRPAGKLWQKCHRNIKGEGILFFFAKI